MTNSLWAVLMPVTSDGGPAGAKGSHAILCACARRKCRERCAWGTSMAVVAIGVEWERPDLEKVLRYPEDVRCRKSPGRKGGGE